MDQDDSELTERVAAYYVRSQGEDAVDYLNERAETAEAGGDAESALVWRQLATAATKLLALLQAT